MQQGHLNQWIDQAKTRDLARTADQQQQVPEAEVQPMVQVIHGPLNKAAAERLRDELAQAEAPREVLTVGHSQKRRHSQQSSGRSITFIEQDLRRVQLPHNDALVISLRIGPAMVQRVLIDQGSSAEVMYFNMFQALKIPTEDLQPTEVPLVGFNGAPIWPLGKITLSVREGSKTVDMDFIVVNVPSP